MRSQDRSTPLFAGRAPSWRHLRCQQTELLDDGAKQWLDSFGCCCWGRPSAGSRRQTGCKATQIDQGRPDQRVWILTLPAAFLPWCGLPGRSVAVFWCCVLLPWSFPRQESRGTILAAASGPSVSDDNPIAAMRKPWEAGPSNAHHAAASCQPRRQPCSRHTALDREDC